MNKVSKRCQKDLWLKFCHNVELYNRIITILMERVINNEAGTLWLNQYDCKRKCQVQISVRFAKNVFREVLSVELTG